MAKGVKELMTDDQIIIILESLKTNPLFNDKHREAFERGIDAINGIHKTGKWIEIPNGAGFNWQHPVWQCEVCGNQFTEKTNYCPDCGSINE